MRDFLRLFVFAQPEKRVSANRSEKTPPIFSLSGGF